MKSFLRGDSFHHFLLVCGFLFLSFGTNSCSEVCSKDFHEVLLSVNPKLISSSGSLVERGFQHCYEFSGNLTDRQLSLCQRDHDYLSCFALGMRRAVQWCSRVFNQSRWNCSHAVRQLVFGKFVHSMSVRERAAVVTMVSAAVMHDITTCCREKKLLDCSCNYSLPGIIESSFEGGKQVSIYGGCSDHLRTPKERTMTMLKVDHSTGSDNCAKGDKHNAHVGVALASKTEIHCHCHGLTASCNVKTCKHRMLSYTEVASKMLLKYEGAVKVLANPDGSLKPSNPNADPPTSTDLVYFEDSPDLCTASAALNVPGTKDRKCKPTTQGTGSCNQLCCGRGFYMRTRETKVYYTDFDTTTFTIVQKYLRTDYVQEHFCN